MLRELVATFPTRLNCYQFVLTVLYSRYSSRRTCRLQQSSKLRNASGTQLNKNFLVKSVITFQQFQFVSFLPWKRRNALRTNLNGGKSLTLIYFEIFQTTGRNVYVNSHKWFSYKTNKLVIICIIVLGACYVVYS